MAPQETDGPRICPHPDCDTPIPLERFACFEHWTGLPVELQTKIYKSFARFKTDPRNEVQTLRNYQSMAQKHWVENP